MKSRGKAGETKQNSNLSFSCLLPFLLIFNLGGFMIFGSSLSGIGSNSSCGLSLIGSAAKKETPTKTIVRNKPFVCIVGCADSKDLAPFNNPDYEFWGVNNLFVSLSPRNYRFDRWFEIHEISFDGTNYKRRGNDDFRGQKVNQYLKMISELGCPVYMQRIWKDIPNSILYPVNAVVKKFGRYFTNTISYMLALAIMEGFKKIAIYGVDMAVGSEYQNQRSSCEWLIGWAKGLDIEIEIPDEADLLKTRFMYGFEEQSETQWNKKIRSQKKSMLKRRNNIALQIMQLEGQLNHLKQQDQQYIGGIHTIEEQLKIWENCKEMCA